MITLYGDKYELDHYVLKRLLKRSGLDESKFRKVPLDDPFLFKYGDNVIITLGDVALQRIIGERDSFRWFNRVIVLNNGTYVIPNLLPSNLLPFKDFDAESDEDSRRHPPRLHGIVCASFRKAEEISRIGYTPKREEHYLEDPTPIQFEQWVDESLAKAHRFISFDIETNYSTRKHSEEDYDESEYDKEILRISFSLEKYSAVSIPFSPEYYPSIRKLLESPAMKIVWNGRTFDIPILNYNGFTVNGIIYDVMDGWHFIQSDLEKGLEFVSGIFTDILPWKHLNNAKPAYYSCVDADAAYQIGEHIYDQLVAGGLWETFKELGIDCMHYLDIAGRNGNYIDIPAQNELRELLQRKKVEISSEIQQLVPQQLKPRSVYKKQPETYDYTEPYATEVKYCSNCREPISNKSEHQKGKDNPCKKAETYVAQGFKTQFVKIDDFNPNSTQQVIGYIKHFSHPLGKNHKTGSETADSKHLRKLNSKYGKHHPIYAKIIEMHKVSKALSTYVEGFSTDNEGKIHTTYVNSPSTWRLGSRNLNVQNCLSADTQILTPHGWVFINTHPDTVAQYNEDGTVEFVKPTDYQHRTNSETIKLSTDYLEIIGTPDHDMVTVSEGKIKKRTIGFLATKATGKVVGGQFIRGGRLKGKKLTDEEWLSLQRAICIQAEGHKTPGHQYIVKVISPRKQAQLKELWPNDCFINPQQYLQVTLRDTDPCLEWLDRDKLVKTFNFQKLLELDSSELDRALKEVMRWDGDFTRGNVYLQQWEKAVEGVQLMACLSGKSTKWGMYHGHPLVNVHRKPIRWISRLFAEPAEVQDTFCMTVPSGMLLVRRNNNIVVVGNCGKRESNPYAKKARKTIIAPPGYSIVQADSSSIEAVMVGYFMNDENYLNIARQSIHAYVACKKLGLDFTKENIDIVKRDYATLYDQFKVTNHMTNYGGTPSMLFSLFPELFPTRKAASEAQQFIFDVLPNLPKWHYEIRTRAQKEGYLQNPFGIRHYFYDVFTYQTTSSGSIVYGPDGLPRVKLGKDAKRSIAFLPQSSAGCFARQNIVRIGKILEEEGHLDWLPAILTVHDSYALVVPDSEIDKAVNILYTVLTRPIPEMGNLTIGCEVEVGKNWGQMERVKV